MATNTIITPDMIAREGIRQLKSNLVASNLVYRGHESEWMGRGFKIGDSVSVRRPVNYTIRSGKTASAQDTVQGKFNVQVNNQKGVDLEFDSDELTLDIEAFSERILSPAVSRIAHEVDKDVLSLYDDVPGWDGTPGQAINSYSDFAKSPESLDILGVPQDPRHAILPPQDHHALAANQTTLGSSDRLVESAFERARLGMIAGCDTYMSQNMPKHTVGALGGTPLVNGASQVSTYANVKDSNQQTLNIDGATASVTGWAKAGDIFTIANVYSVNPVTGESTGELQQFAVDADVNSDGSGAVALTITPAIITSGAYKTCDSAPADNAAITIVGSAATEYRHGLVFHPNAFALVVVPMVKDLPGADCSVATDEDTGLSMRYARQYDVTNDKVVHRLDVLYGVKTLDGRLARRLSGTA